MRPSFRVGLFASSCIGGLLLVTTAAAQPKATPPAGADRSNSQFNLRRDAAGAADGQLARSRAQAGDCAGALPAFDAALRTSTDPTLRRDRGLCHEKLGDPFPAMDDFRAYLHAKPEAADAEDIRLRLIQLEGAGGGRRDGKSADVDSNPELGGGNARASASVSVGTKGASGSASSESGGSQAPEVIGPKPGEQVREYDYYVQQERLGDAAQKSPLRYGSGVVLGPFLQLPRFFLGDGARKGTLAYSVGLAFRYVFGRTFSLVGELGYGGVGTAGEATSQGGVLLFGGAELRFPVSKWASDHLVLRGGVGYERQVVSGTRFINDDILARFAFGYRHVFGPSLGVEALADGGPVLVLPEKGDSRINGVVGLSMAFLVGF